MIFFFEFVYIVDYVNGFSYIEPTLHPWDEAYLFFMNDGFDYGIPNHYYYSIIKKGYEDCHLDQQYLDHAVNSMKEIVKEIEQKETYHLGYKDVRQ